MPEKNICNDCNLPKWRHTLSWFDFLIDQLPTFHVNRYPTINALADLILEKGLRTIGLARHEYDYDLAQLPMRSGLFLQELKDRKIPHAVTITPFGHTDHIEIVINHKKIMIDGLPLGPRNDLSQWEDKSLVKKIAEKNGIPTAQGQSFYFFQKKAAQRFAQEIGYPLVVKPINGSVSRHVTTNITSLNQFTQALEMAFQYSPQCLIERYIGTGRVHRATIVDMRYTGCIQQIPAHIVGDGVHTIQQLIEQKNKARGSRLYHPILVDKTTLELLSLQKYSLGDIPAQNSFIKLQHDPFLKLGGDIKDMSDDIHPENQALFEKIARIFNLHLVGIDFILEDIKKPWHMQTSALLEINTLPSIEMHHIPSIGTSRNIAAKLVDMMYKYHG